MSQNSVKSFNEYSSKVDRKYDISTLSSIYSSRDKVVEILSENNELLAKVLRIHMEYNNGSVCTDPIVEQGIKFYIVGHNASHEFYLGVKDGKVYRMSYGGEYDYDEENDESESRFGSNILEIDLSKGLGYVGHF